MSIYSEDRTMLTIDPMAESKTMPGYDSITDLYKIIEESVREYSIIYRSIVESEASVLTLSEADGAKTAKRAETYKKVAAASVAKYMKAVAKLKSVCVGTKNRLDSFRTNKIDKMADKYSVDFNKNKDLATSSRFTISYDNKALLCTNKELEKVAIKASKAAKDLAKNSYSLAANNAAEINKNKHKVYAVPAVAKYADSFCCCCGEKPTKETGNPFTGGFTPAKLVAELGKSGSIDATLDKLCEGANQAANELTKVVATIQKTAEKNADKIDEKDLEAMSAMTAIVDSITKGLVHATSDIVRIYRKHMSECIKVYIAVAKMKAQRVVKENSNVIIYTADEFAMMEAYNLEEDLQDKLDI